MIERALSWIRHLVDRWLRVCEDGLALEQCHSPQGLQESDHMIFQGLDSFA